MRPREELRLEDDDVGSPGQGAPKKPKLYSIFCRPAKLRRPPSRLDTCHQTEQASQKELNLPFLSSGALRRQGDGQEDDGTGRASEDVIGYQEEDEGRKIKPYSIFCRPTKTVYLVRHGNTWLKKYVEPSPCVLDRCMFDLPLTKLGVRQAVALGKDLCSLKADVIICSPLTRALETLQYALPSLQSARYEISAIHTESLQVSGDVGRSPEHLAKEFPWVSFGGVDPVWWYSHPEAPNDSCRCLFQRREPVENVRARIGSFRRFLCARPEAVIVVIGHSSFFMGVLGTDKRLGNCEWTKIRL